MATQFELDLEKKIKQAKEEQLSIEKERVEIEKLRGKFGEADVKRLELRNKNEQEATKALELKKKQEARLAKTVREETKQSADAAKQLGDNIEGFINEIPGGGFLMKSLGLDKLGDQMKEALVTNLQKSVIGGKELGSVFKLSIGGPAKIILGSLAAIFAVIRQVRKAARDLGGELNISTKEAQAMLPALKFQEMRFKVMGLDSAKIKTTLSAMTDEFGSMENVSVANAAAVSRMAQNLGTSGKEVVQFNKVMMDLSGASFDTATSMAQTAANMAKAANVAPGKVLSDMASNAQSFAKFSMQGAEGFAKAAIEAAKVGSSIESILGSADKLLDFESSITSQFKAQVLTGKQINTERARQLALDGDIAGLTSEIQSIVGQVGDIQTLNVIQRQSVADAIGISVQDLLRISRGEAAQQTKTTVDVLENGVIPVLVEGLDVDKKILESSEDKNVNVIQPAF